MYSTYYQWTTHCSSYSFVAGFEAKVVLLLIIPQDVPAESILDFSVP